MGGEESRARSANGKRSRSRLECNRTSLIVDARKHDSCIAKMERLKSNCRSTSIMIPNRPLEDQRVISEDGRTTAAFGIVLKAVSHVLPLAIEPDC